MCEPTHSITQMPDQDPDSGMPTEQILGLEKKPDSFLKKILRWFHFSKLGRGHHEGIAASPLADKKLEQIGYAQYEALWWERKVQRDGPPVWRLTGWDWRNQEEAYAKRELASQEAFDCAKEYANRVSIGSLSALRRFLEGSLKCTDRACSYIEAFRNMLNPQGKLQLENKLKLVGMVSSGYYHELPSKLLEPVTNTILGLTRKRKLLIPEWADDSNLWKGGSNETVELKIK